MRELSIDSILSRVEHLPEIPQLALKVMQMLNDPDIDMETLAEVISTDQGLTAKLLRLCNSAYYGLQRRVTTTSEAIVLLGFNTIKNLVMMVTTQGVLSKGLIGYRMEAGTLWNHSLGTAEICRFLATKSDYEQLEEAFIAGLLHDIGKILLNQHALPEVYRATNLHLQEQMPLAEAESEILSFNHADIGAALAEQWNFPDILVDAIRHHHAFKEASGLKSTLPILVGTANILFNMFEEEEAYELFYENKDVIFKTVGITELMLPSLLPELKEHVSEVNQLAMALT